MKNNFSYLAGLSLMFLFIAQSVEAQILQERSEVLASYGVPFSEGVSESGERYLYYKTPVQTKASGKYEQRKVVFFKKLKDGTETCFKWQILEPSSETKQNMLSYTRNLVQTGKMEWKDYNKGIVYKMELVNGVCAITAWYDQETSLAKVYKM